MPSALGKKETPILGAEETGFPRARSLCLSLVNEVSSLCAVMAVGRGGLDKGGGTNFCEARSKNRPGKRSGPWLVRSGLLALT